MTATLGRPASKTAQVSAEYPAKSGDAGYLPGLAADYRGALVEIVVPVYNEEQALETCIRTLTRFLGSQFPFRWAVTVADNASTDRTWEIAGRLAAENPEVRALHLGEKGRGRALRAAWLASNAEVVAYMDVDLSTDLKALLPIVAPLISGHSEIAIGSRLLKASRVSRGPKRELISRCYNYLLRVSARARFADAQCGFKALRRDAAEKLLAEVENENWFFDTELLLLAQRSGMRICEIPVDWVDDPDSRVRVAATALEDLRGLLRVKRRIRAGGFRVAHAAGSRSRNRAAPAPVFNRRPGRRLVSFAAVGTLTTALYLAGFAALRNSLGPLVANATCLTATTVINTALNRRFTFGISGRTHALRHHLAAAAVFVLALALTTGTLAIVKAIFDSPSRAVELASLVVANGVATLARFAILSTWVFRRSPRVGSASTGSRHTSGTPGHLNPDHRKEAA